MKKILILCRRDDRVEYDRAESMLEGMQAYAAQAQYEVANYEDLLFAYDSSVLSVINTATDTDIAAYDALFLIGWFKTKALDDVAHAVTHYAQSKGVAFANSEAYFARSFTKLSQYVIAAINGVQITPFLFALDQQLLLAEVKKRQVAFPYIAKAIAASRGRDNYLITDHTQLADAISEISDPPKFFIVQEYVPNDGDYRILVMGGVARLAIHRKAIDSSHLNNTSQGGAATLVDLAKLPDSVLEQSVQSAKLLRREVTGVDMIKHQETGEYYFLEANNMPQLATGSFVKEKMRALDMYLAELAGSAPLKS